MTIRLKNGDVVLVTFPFTNLKGEKLRPSVIISTDEVHQDTSNYTLLFISSVIVEPLSAYELLFDEAHPDFKKSGLKKRSIFKANKIATVQKALIKRKLGELGNQIRKELGITFDKAIKIIY